MIGELTPRAAAASPHADVRRYLPAYSARGRATPARGRAPLFMSLAIGQLIPCAAAAPRMPARPRPSRTRTCAVIYRPTPRAAAPLPARGRAQLFMSLVIGQLIPCAAAAPRMPPHAYARR